MIYRVFVDKENHDGMENHRCGYIHIDLPQLYRVFVDKENHRCGYIHIDLPQLYRVFVDKENHDGMENHRCGYIHIDLPQLYRVLWTRRTTNVVTYILTYLSFTRCLWTRRTMMAWRTTDVVTIFPLYPTKLNTMFILLLTVTLYNE
jgi:uncharacterized protein with PQ loop repeat